MQLTPRYGEPPVLVIDGLADPSAALLQQTRRCIGALEGLTDAQWASASRCDGWTSTDVLLHLDTVFGFWLVSVQRGLAGAPTQYLQGFDPVATPAALVAQGRGARPVEVVARLAASVDGLEATFADGGAEAWDTVVEAPPGHVAMRAAMLHALWDSWVHERDVLLPLGLDPVEDDAEVLAALRYAVGLGPAFAVSSGDERTGTLVVEVTDPAARFRVDVGPTVRVSDATPGDGPAHICGRAVDVLEALSVRAPLVADLPEGDRWMLTGLTTVFDQ